MQLLAVYSVACVILIGFYIWMMYTKSGKKWLDELR
jgi:hypothetical protein